MTIWYMLCSFDTFSPVLVHFSGFGIKHQIKSGNLASRTECLFSEQISDCDKTIPALCKPRAICYKKTVTAFNLISLMRLVDYR
jgi:hypothetical protein